MSTGSQRRIIFNCFPSCIFTIIAFREREREVRKGEEKRQKERKSSGKTGGEGGKKAGCAQERWRGRGRMLPKQFLLNTQGKMLAADTETNTAKCRNKYSNFLHTHTRTKSQESADIHQEATHTQKGLHVNVGGCELRWMRDGRRLVGRKRQRG